MLQAAINNLRNEIDGVDGVDQRTLYQAIDTMQEYADYLEDLADNLPPVDLSVTIKIDGATVVKFPDVDNLAKFLAERMNA
jgi:hypothetical protein